MTKADYSRNAFEAMCELAQAGWCWRLGCTTCGNKDFRFGFLALSRGGHPDTDNWIPKLRKQHKSWAWKKYSEVESDFLVNVLSTASVRNIADCYDRDARSEPFPDWLGYLGQALHEVSYVRDSGVYRKLSASWNPELIGILPAGSTPIKKLEEISSNPNGRLQLHILEEIETALIGYPRERKKRQELFTRRAD